VFSLTKCHMQDPPYSNRLFMRVPAWREAVIFTGAKPLYTAVLLVLL
jgi:hypothetical protein